DACAPSEDDTWNVTVSVGSVVLRITASVPTVRGDGAGSRESLPFRPDRNGRLRIACEQAFLGASGDRNLPDLNDPQHSSGRGPHGPPAKAISGVILPRR